MFIQDQSIVHTVLANQTAHWYNFESLFQKDFHLVANGVHNYSTLSDKQVKRFWNIPTKSWSFEFCISIIGHMFANGSQNWNKFGRPNLFKILKKIFIGQFLGPWRMFIQNKKIEKFLHDPLWHKAYVNQ